MAANNRSLGGAQAKQHSMAVSICRDYGWKETSAAMANKTCSNHKGDGKHRHYESAGEGLGGNVHGYSPGGEGGGYKMKY